ncbi:hypothetical protein BJ508DRAFT_418604 [Ascobolus immersus RN42]|uniref:Uncharacterized protein n=1 Tax=Ascobolus immersus RN42 TaxID=1160509 RepID=A0A3N4HL27_ASCIM|nr:hypothetical protein BJ508DRAFT_418604 [Ascobolus immersus RN42]
MSQETVYIYSGSIRITSTKVTPATTATNPASTNGTSISTDDPNYWRIQLSKQVGPLKALPTVFTGYSYVAAGCNKEFSRHVMTFKEVPTTTAVPSLTYCFPYNFTYYPVATAAMERAYYSPAVCPKGYTTDESKITTSYHHLVPATALDPMETRGICCPKGGIGDGKWTWDLGNAACRHAEGNETTFAAPMFIRWRSDDKLKWKIENSKDKLSGGAIAGIVIGSIVGLMALGAFLFYNRRELKRNRAKMAEKVELVVESRDQHELNEGSSLVVDGRRQQHGGA